MIIHSEYLSAEAELGEEIVYVTYGEVSESGHVSGTSERIGHLIPEEMAYPTTEEELRSALEYVVSM